MEVTTKVIRKVLDSDASPYIEQKGVILCRSGIQLYHKSELQGFITEENKPPVDKEWYKEYRPANVIVKAKDLCASLPVTNEHPNEWVNSKNWKDLTGGTTDKEVDVVALDGESDGEIGLKSTVTFYDEKLYDYYQENKEVSLGYTCKKHFVANPEEVGYDIILDEITEVNHLAITRSGRGGSSVAVIDSLIGGLKPMRTGIFAWFASKKQKDSAPASFGKSVIDALEASKGTTEEELAKDMACVLDSCAVLKDGEQKNTLVNAIRDCFDNRDKALANKEELMTTLDSMYVSLSGDSLQEIVDAIRGCTASAPSISITDSGKDKGDEEKAEDSDKEEEKGEEDKSEDSDKPKDKEGKKAEDSAVKDSNPVTRDELVQAVKDSLKELVPQIVKETLGIKENGKTPVEGSQIDSNLAEPVLGRDYSEFLE